MNADSSTSKSSTTPPTPSIDPVTKLNDWLLSPIENGIPNDNVIQWWSNQTKYPRLRQMALDYLSIPGMYHPIHELHVLH